MFVQPPDVLLTLVLVVVVELDVLVEVLVVDVEVEVEVLVAPPVELVVNSPVAALPPVPVLAGVEPPGPGPTGPAPPFWLEDEVSSSPDPDPVTVDPVAQAPTRAVPAIRASQA